MKKLFLLLLILVPMYAMADSHVVKAVYIEIEPEDREYYSSYIEVDDRYFVKTKLESGLYEIEIGDKLDSKFYAIRYSKYFLEFRYTPYLYKFDEGILKIENGYDAGKFIEED